MTFWEKVKLFFSPVKHNKFRYAVLFFYSLTFSITGVYFVIFLEKIAKAIELGDKQLLITSVIRLGLMPIIQFVLRLFVKPYNFKVISDCYAYLEGKYLEKYLSLDNNDTDKIGTGRFISIMQKGIDAWTTELELVFWDKTMAIVSIIFSLYYIVIHSIQFFVYSIILIIVSAILTRFFGRKAFFYRKKSKEVLIEGDRMFVRRIMSKFEIIQQSKIGHEITKKKLLRDAWYRLKFKEKVQQSYGYDTVMLMTSLLTVLLTLFVGLSVINNNGFTISDFILLTGLGSLISDRIFSFMQQIRRSEDKFIHVQKLRDTFDSLKTIKGYNEGTSFTYNAGGISIKNMTYSYGEKPVFQNFSLDIKAGKKTAFVGLSGAGKTTLIKLLAGYLQADSGSIIIDGQDLSDVALKTYYQSVGYLTQEPSVFDGTIRENLLYSLPSGATIESIQKQVDHILGLAKCDFVYDLPKGIDTEIGERGIRLSGGQKQRLAIAKIFLKDPKIIILDEPTSALDSFSEEAITEAMHNLYEGRTVLIIAHRLQTVKEADEIVVLDYNEKAQSSEVIEHGTHDELVSKKGFYAKMLEVQTGF